MLPSQLAQIDVEARVTHLPESQGESVLHCDLFNTDTRKTKATYLAFLEMAEVNLRESVLLCDISLNHFVMYPGVA